MALAFHVNNFKPWAPRRPRQPKPFSLRKCPNSRALEARIPPAPPPPPLPAPRCDASASALLSRKHGLPLKPPAEVCVPISSDVQPCSPLSSPSQSRKMSIPSPSSKNPRHGVSSLHEPAHHTSNLHPTSSRDIRGNISDTPIELPPLGRGATGADPSSPSVTSSDGSLEDFFGLPDLQNTIPIDPAILADDASWATSDLRRLAQQGDDLASPKATYPYPEPPLSMSCDTPNHHQGSRERPDSWNRNSQTDDDTHVLDHRQIHPARCSTDVDVPCSYSTSDDFLSDAQARRRKRGPQQPEEPAAKRLHVASVSSMEGPSTALRSHFLSLQLDERLQFLSWLFEGALASCMPDSAPAMWGDGSVRSAGRSAPHKVGETQRERGEGRKGHRDKLWRWLPEEDARLLNMVEERRPWPEVERCFPARTESALRQRVSTLRKQERGMRTAEPAGVIVASVAPEGET
ncbi:predicted protein [Histoplasma mississippiense (nom. inval.)]|uniref:predicted protein n=1 Tax=Ajellomyces capsulatus (strain NAm1 / WU24) TaxID=2059318 RepID=UPI000157B3D0|nr:predicted protein [Histoplasma mississippiense (nom. inval.)]EDN02512.1 predicted protein [Histoplasma mississippiense (nom. inval.)]